MTMVDLMIMVVMTMMIMMMMVMFEIEDDDDNDDGGDGIDDEGNFVDGITANGDVSNVKHLIGETRSCFLKQKTYK